MKLKIYIFTVMATLFLAPAAAQERLINGDFPSFQANDFSAWWPDGWLFEGEWTENCITANDGKRLQFEHRDGASVRRVYQNVNLGIGTFVINTNADIHVWDSITPYSIVVTDPNNVVMFKDTLTLTNQEYLDLGPWEFTTTVNAPYKFAIECVKDSTNGWSQAYIFTVSLMQIDGDEYDPDGPTDIESLNAEAKSLNAYVANNKIVLNSEEIILSTRIISINGSVIYRSNVNKTMFEMARPAQSGVYFVVMETATQNKIIKLAF